jgi:Ca-activated chloride channel family protein
MDRTKPTAELRAIIDPQSDAEPPEIALRGVRVRSRLSGMSQKTIVEQMFVNLEDRAIEAVYTFPVPDGAAVCGFEVITGDRVLTGVIEENEKAIEKYDDAIELGHAAYMLESDRPDVFTARVGNLKPKQSATIRLTYVAPLERVDRQIRVTFPTTVAPRYEGQAGMDPLEGMIDAEALNPPKALWVPYGLSLEVDVDLRRKVNSIVSPTHAIRVTEMDDPESVSHRVLLEGAQTQMDRDIVLTIDLAREHEPAAEVARGPDGAPYVAVSFVPEFDVDELTQPQPSETTFVLDCSGSMQGESIRQAVAALELCLRSLSPGDTFNVCRFGSTFETMSSEPLVYSQSTLDKSLAYVRQIVDMGGTEIMQPLQTIFETAPRTGAVRNIILLTDGQVTNEPAVVALARQHRQRNRIFSFGIGTAASSFLVNGLARATRGAAEFITGDERIEEKVLRTFSRIGSPMVEQIEIDWGGADVQTLAEVPPVFDGDLLTVFGRVQGSPPKAVTLQCLVGNESKRWSVALPRERDDGGVIATMWARRTIQSLEEVNDVRRLPTREPVKERPRQLIIDLSKQFNLVSSLTTFIAIEHRSIEERNEGRPALRRVPVALAAGWGGMDRFSRAVGLTAMAAAAPARVRSVECDDPGAAMMYSKSSAGFSGLGKSLRSLVSRAKAAKPLAAGAGESSGPVADELSAILALQSADGWFEWDETLISKVLPESKQWHETIERSIERLTRQPVTLRDRLTQTAVVLLIFAKRFADREKLWRRAELKARRWIASVARTDATSVQRWLQEIRQTPLR